jgi:hypothetical protein
MLINLLHCDILMIIMLKYFLTNFFFFCSLLTLSPHSLSLQIFPVVMSSYLILNLVMDSIRLRQGAVVIRRFWANSALKWLLQSHIPVPNVAMFIVEKEVSSTTWNGNVAKILALYVHTVPLSRNINHLCRDILGDVIRTNCPTPYCN